VRQADEIRKVADDINVMLGARRVLALQADVTQEADCRRLVDEAIAAFGGLHILVNNAGRGMKYMSATFLAGSSVTVNGLLPGGATDTGMIPDGVSEAVRRQLLRPEAAAGSQSTRLPLRPEPTNGAATSCCPRNGMSVSFLELWSALRCFDFTSPYGTRMAENAPLSIARARGNSLLSLGPGQSRAPFTSSISGPSRRPACKSSNQASGSHSS